MPADNLPHPLHAAEINLPAGNFDTLGRWRDRRSDDRLNRVLELGKIGLGYRRQAALERQHVVP